MLQPIKIFLKIIYASVLLLHVLKRTGTSVKVHSFGCLPTRYLLHAALKFNPHPTIMSTTLYLPHAQVLTMTTRRDKRFVGKIRVRFYAAVVR